MALEVGITLKQAQANRYFSFEILEICCLEIGLMVRVQENKKMFLAEKRIRSRDVAS